MTTETQQTVQRVAAEHKYAKELTSLEQADKDPKPKGWALSPRSVRKFILGDKSLGVSQKFFGDDPLIDRCIVSLMGQQGLMLVGEPGTAKSLLSELLSAAISGTSGLIIQGSAGIIEDHLRYGWNYSLLLAEGPSEKALIPSPIMSAMREGKIARVEELTRCAPEVQDAMISLMSEKNVAIPELGADVAVQAISGFNIIATSNLRDRGVHDMSSALKRRFNFETVHPIADPKFEKELITKQLDEKLAAHDVKSTMTAETLDVLVSVFRDLRTGKTSDGATVAVPNSVLSTAEAVNVAYAASLDAAYLDGGTLSGKHIARQMGGIVFKDDVDDARKFRAYVDHIAKVKAKKSKTWKAFYTTAKTELDR